MDAEALKNLARERATAWTEGPYDADTRARVQQLIDANGEELVESF